MRGGKPCRAQTITDDVYVTNTFNIPLDLLSQLRDLANRRAVLRVKLSGGTGGRPSVSKEAVAIMRLGIDAASAALAKEEAAQAKAARSRPRLQKVTLDSIC